MIREVRKRQGLGDQQAARLLAALFSVELAQPSRCIWIISPWISDVELLDNSALSFSSLERWGPRPVRLAEVLLSLAERGTRVVVGTTRAPSNQRFLGRIRALFRAEGLDQLLTISIDEDGYLHAKSIVADDFAIVGSMNFTVSGIELREEYVQLQYLEELVAGARIEAQARYGGVS